MDKESYLDFRKRIQNYVLSMTIFKRHYLEGTLSEELYELKFDNGLRIYYTEIENTIILLFTGGNKSKQSKDIEIATKYLNDYNERKNNE